MISSPPYDPMAVIDTSVPNWARVWHYLLGGKDAYGEDREAADQFMAVYPGIARAVQYSRHFQSRAVRHLAVEAGVRQFLDIGAGFTRFPGDDDTHEIAQREARESKVVYVDNDPLVIAFGRAIQHSGPEGHIAHIQADARDIDKIWTEVEIAGLDPDQPVAVLLINVLEFLDHEDAHTMLKQLQVLLAPGSYLVVSHLAKSPYGVMMQDIADRARNTGALELRPRSIQHIRAYFDGLDVLEPGIVQCPRWRPEAALFEPTDVPMYAGVGRKPASST
ncbi:SAM-dependent methyltransferase [Spirillospora sp. NPDC000708]